MARKKPRRNSYAKQRAQRRARWMAVLKTGLAAMGVAAASILISLGCIFVYDGITQCDQFRAKHISVEGQRRVSRNEILLQSGLKPDINIFAVNLRLARKRLLLHPWIAAAEIRREIPSGLFIKVKEQKAIAVVDIGRKYLINEKGWVFKPMTAGDPKDLIVIRGLDLSDLRVEAPDHSAWFGQSDTGTDQSATFTAVMDIMRLGAKIGSVLPNRLIKRIHVDREIGLTVYAFNELKMIRLGYDNYAAKYDILKRVITFLEKKKTFAQYDRIDINSLNRVVISRVNF